MVCLAACTKKNMMINDKKINMAKEYGFIFACLLTSFMFSCATVDPRDVDVKLKKELPAAKITSFSQALTNLGLMTVIYDTDIVKIQASDILDSTGTSGATITSTHSKRHSCLMRSTSHTWRRNFRNSGRTH